MKMPQVFEDPKFWAALVMILGTFGITQIGTISTETFVDALKIIGSAFLVSKGVEHGLQKVGSETVLPVVEEDEEF